MIDRTLLESLRLAVAQVPVVALLGSRQTGKTTLAKEVALSLGRERTIYLDLELDSDRAALRQPELFLERHRGELVVIDEIQRQPDLFPLIRALVDRDRRPGRFLLLGSASPTLIRHSADSLAGRVRYYEVPPFTIPEIPGADWQKLWLRGGYPESYLAQTDAESFRWRLDFLATFLERDIPMLGVRIPAAQLRRSLVMLAHWQGQLWNASQFSLNLGITAPTAKHYLDLMTDTYLCRMVEPFFENVGKRLVKSPKVYLRDSGLVHALLGIQTWDQLISHPIVGHSWEGFACETIIRSLPVGWQNFFYRTSAGSEMDLVLISPTGERLGVEIKFSQNPTVTKGFYLSTQDLKTTTQYIVYPGDRVIPLNATTEIVPLEVLVKQLALQPRQGL